MFRSEACGARNITKAQIMLNQGRPYIEGRAKRSPNRKRSRPGMGRARAGDPGEGWQDGRSVVWVGVFIDGCRARGAGSLPGR